MLDITEGNQTELKYSSKISRQTLKAVQSKYSWEDDYSPFDNLSTAYNEMFIDSLFELARQSGDEDEVFFNKLTKPQKVMHVLSAFEGQVENGGIFQFFWNIPHFHMAVLQALDEIRAEDLKRKYNQVLEEFVPHFDMIEQLREQAAIDDFEASVDLYNQGREKLIHTKWFDTEFYDKANQKQFHQRICTYVEKNIDLIAVIE